MIPAHDRDVHLVELKHRPDTNPFPSLQIAAALYAGTMYDNYTVAPPVKLGLTRNNAENIAPQ
eukprot:1161499-Pelagomonas_calceolata.AAC.10